MNDSPTLNEAFRGILTSKYIGVKVFLNSISTQFGFAPTKVLMYKARKDNNNPDVVFAEQIQTKGACSKRLIDFGINGDDNVKLFLTYNELINGVGRSEVSNHIKRLMKCSSVRFEGHN